MLIIIIVVGASMAFLQNEDDEIPTVIGTGEAQIITLSLKNFNYYPNTVTVKAGQPVRIYLDDSVGGCLRDFTIKDFGVRKYLATPQDYVEFTPNEKGRHTFACSMGMGTGVLIVE